MPPWAQNADRSIVEPIAIYMTAELLGLLELLHSLQIVHADIKPDNFLVRHTPSTQSSPSLQVIDFGKAIDLRLEEEEGEAAAGSGQLVESGDGLQQTPEETKDESAVKPEQKGRTGKYHLDYFGIAGSHGERTKCLGDKRSLLKIPYILA
jgi:serine/threonine protein kinase